MRCRPTTHNRQHYCRVGTLRTIEGTLARVGSQSSTLSESSLSYLSFPKGSLLASPFFIYPQFISSTTRNETRTTKSRRISKTFNGTSDFDKIYDHPFALNEADHDDSIALKTCPSIRLPSYNKIDVKNLDKQNRIVQIWLHHHRNDQEPTHRIAYRPRQHRKDSADLGPDKARIMVTAPAQAMGTI